MSAAGYTIRPVTPLPKHEIAAVELTCSSCSAVFVIVGPKPGDFEDPVCRPCLRLDEEKP